MTQQIQRLLVLHREQAEKLAVAMPRSGYVRVFESELSEGVSRLGCLLSRAEVPASDDVEFITRLVLRFFLREIHHFLRG